MVKQKNEEIQIKFTVNEKQKQRLDILAEQREVSVPQFAKLTALGVRMTPAPIIQISRKYTEEKELLEEILKLYKVQEDGAETIYISSKFDFELVSKIKKYLNK